ncbi:DJ-1/PfpI family protein [Piscinibacter terrae]|uniref:Glutamine amidotransferase n=1 Tax=Piscinibacter terrae TaxID=2496871 RepID=A0A3N7HWL9_9BURK|nr:DJ-1/PfpI family protein [Albitalea terrae]RQP26778.1 glutamine amidotransferase [Albitalea terrae]
MQQQETVHLFVFDTLSDWEIGYAIAGINNPMYQKRPGRYRVKTVSLANEPITTAGGLTVLPNMPLGQLTPEQSAMFILPGGRLWDDGKDLEAASLAKRFIAAGVPVAAICGATAGLARVGVLDLMRHTSNAPEYLKFTGYLGAALYQNERAVADGKLITAGATAPLEFAREIFRQLDVYDDDVLDAWFGLFQTGNPAYYSVLASATQGS